MKIRRAEATAPTLSMVAMIDILMIMLVFFMVTSTYLNLSMLPLVQADESGAAAPASADMPAPNADLLLLRLTGEDAVVHRGQPLGPAKLRELLAARVADQPAIQVLVLPAPRASTQALVSLLDAATGAGVTQVRLVQLDGTP